MRKPAVVLLSGGLDSATVAAIARREDFDVHALSFSYGQRHSAELDAADRVANQVGVKDHKTIPIDLRAFGGSALTADIARAENTSLAVQYCLDHPRWRLSMQTHKYLGIP